jgi:hypothetical protein
MSEMVVIVKGSPSRVALFQAVPTAVRMNQTGDKGPTGDTGPIGPQGPVGGAVVYLNIQASVALGGHRAVYASGSGQVDYADRTNPAHRGKVLGITTGAVSQGVDVQIQQAGEITEPSWNWSNGPVYLNTNGTLTQTAPTSGFLQEIGVAISPTRLMIDLKPPVTLV